MSLSDRLKRRLPFLSDVQLYTYLKGPQLNCETVIFMKLKINELNSKGVFEFKEYTCHMIFIIEIL